MVKVSPRLLHRRIEAAKAGVSILAVAKDLGSDLNKKGERWRGQCPICLNGQRSDAFSVDVARGLFFCHACGSGGDLVRLVEASQRMSLPEAVAWLGHNYNIDLPGRPDAWFRKQDRQARIRQEMIEQRREVKRRRLFKYLILPEIEKVPEADQERETNLAWGRMKQLNMGDLDQHGPVVTDRERLRDVMERVRRAKELNDTEDVEPFFKWAHRVDQWIYNDLPIVERYLRDLEVRSE
jgi:hypothetical protein